MSDDLYGRRLDDWIAETTRLARESSPRRKGPATAIASRLDDLTDYLSELREHHLRETDADLVKPRTIRTFELSPEWVLWIAAQAYASGSRDGLRLEETSPSIREFMVKRTTATIRALGVAHKALSANPNAQPPATPPTTDNRRGDAA